MKSGNVKESRSLLIVIFSLLVFGLFIIYNSTAYYAQSTFGNPFRFVFLQSAWILAGLVGFIFFSNFDYKRLKTISFILFVISIGFLLFLGFIGLVLCRNPESVGILFAPCINGASRWFYFNPEPLPALPYFGVLGLQPSELAKLAIILYLSTQLSKFEKIKNPEFAQNATSLAISFDDRKCVVFCIGLSYLANYNFYADHWSAGHNTYFNNGI